MNTNKIKFFIKIIIGVIFIISSIFKLNSIDDFEIYIFGLQYFSLNTSFVLARIIIGGELFLGIMLLLNIYKSIIYITLCLLILFTLFLFNKIILGNTENCHCFGETIILNPFQSVIKNIILIIGLLWIKKSNFFTIKFKKNITAIFLLFSFAIPNIASPPDFLYYQEYEHYATYNKEAFAEFFASEINYKKKDKTIICFLSTGCKYCKLTAKKIVSISEKHNINKDYILFVFSESNNIEEFRNETKTKEIPFIQLPKKQLFRLTDGGVPLIVLHKNEVVHTFIYRNIDEQKIKDFISNN
ncbi:MAG TPA: hypothetical protein DEH02_09260 [Bacteroidales bacterium]|nr:MAG: hypothetical protein A2X01_00840 [Bacteroidetes bacterium GWF2_35_48]OFY99711.1 MAG: hypothetical protein A2491_16945 [Bacteroidetes bacterium RIFOXYC12_FULL_35_7]HBX51238.1 hypothetical protein [Bacteroidales bacterium]